MTGRIIDKTIIFLMLIALLITSDLTVTMMVIAVLLILFTGFVTELFRKNEFFVILGALALVLSYILKQPIFLFTFPMITYAFASFKEHIFREEKRETKDIVFSIIEGVMVAGFCLSSVTWIPMILVILAAVPMGLRSSYLMQKQ